MSITQLSPYVNFAGSAEKAIHFYQRTLGAKAEQVMRFGEARAMGHPCSDAHKDLIMHAVLHLGAAQLMLSDGPPGAPAPTDTNIQLSLAFDDPAELARKFAALADGGQITVPLHDAFWGAKFGMLTDAFGIRWMFNGTPSQA